MSSARHSTKLAIEYGSSSSSLKSVNIALGGERLPLHFDLELTSCRTLKSTNGCVTTNVECQKRAYLLERSLGHFAPDPVMYAFVPGLPRAFELKRGFCISPGQIRESRTDLRCLTPLTARSEGRHDEYLPPIYITKVSKAALNAEPAPAPGGFDKSPYLLGPQWNMGPALTLRHNLRILRERLWEPLHVSLTSCKTPFTVYPDPLPHNRGRQNYEIYVFQFPGAPPVDEKGILNPTHLAEVAEPNAGGSDET